jgi:hypothetical protein
LPSGFSSPKPILTTSAARRKALRTKRHRHASSLIKRLNDCRRLEHAISVGSCKQQNQDTGSHRHAVDEIELPSPARSASAPITKRSGAGFLLAFGCLPSANIEFVEVGHMA